MSDLVQRAKDLLGHQLTMSAVVAGRTGKEIPPALVELQDMLRDLIVELDGPLPSTERQVMQEEIDFLQSALCQLLDCRIIGTDGHWRLLHRGREVDKVYRLKTDALRDAMAALEPTP